MIHTVKTVRTLETIALTLGLAVFLWSTGLPTVFHLAKATATLDADDAMSNMTPGESSDHTIAFEVPQGLGIGETFVLTFPTDVHEFVFGSLSEDDVDILINGISQKTARESDAGTWGVSIGQESITFVTPSDSDVAQAASIVVRIGKNAVDFGTGSHQITNPTHVASYVVDIEGTMQDSGSVIVPIIEEGTPMLVETSRTFVVPDAGRQSATSLDERQQLPRQIITPTF